MVKQENKNYECEQSASTNLEWSHTKEGRVGWGGVVEDEDRDKNENEKGVK